MNRKQKIICWVALVIILGLFLDPPMASHHIRSHHSRSHSGIIWDELIRLVIIVVMIAGIGVGLCNKDWGVKTKILNWLESWKSARKSSKQRIPQSSSIRQDIQQYPLAIDESARPRPWRRFFARCADNFLIGFLILFFLMPFFQEKPPLVWLFCGTLLLALIEAAMLASWGTTIGKWILGITVRRSDGSNLSYFQALDRGLYVWFRGMGCNVPPISIITGIMSYRYLVSNGVAPWDRPKVVLVSCSRLVWYKVVLIILLASAAIGLAAYFTNYAPPADIHKYKYMQLPDSVGL